MAMANKAGFIPQKTKTAIYNASVKKAGFNPESDQSGFSFLTVFALHPASPEITLPDSGKGMIFAATECKT